MPSPQGDEAVFREWYARMAQQYGLGPDPDVPDQFYDYRAAFRAGATPDASRHWPSQFKRAGHPNEIVGGFNTRTGERVPGTPQASEQELVRLGWDSATAARLSQKSGAVMPDPQLDIGAALAELDIGSELSSLGAPTPAVMRAPGVLRPDPRGSVQRGLESFSQMGPVPGAIVGGLKRADNLVRGSGDLLRAGANLMLPESMEFARPYQTQGDAPPVSPNEALGSRAVQAAETVGGMLGGAKLISAVPAMMARGLGVSSARAGRNIQSAMQAAKNVRVPGTSVEPSLVRAGELVATGSSRPRAVVQLSKRLADGGDLSFQEAQDFASSMSRLSANEFNRMNPQMQRQVTTIRNALRQALTESAETVGKGREYQQGIREYAKSARAAERWESIKPTLALTLKRALEGAGLATGGTLAYKAMSQ